jgi:hypothetical protein
LRGDERNIGGKKKEEVLGIEKKHSCPNISVLWG